MAEANKEQEETYEEIMTFYDVTETMIDAVEFGDLEQPEAYVPILEKFIDQVEDTAEVLMEMLIFTVETGEPLKGSKKRKAVMSVKRLLRAIERFDKAGEKLN